MSTPWLNIYIDGSQRKCSRWYWNKRKMEPFIYNEVPRIQVILISRNHRVVFISIRSLSRECKEDVWLYRIEWFEYRDVFIAILYCAITRWEKENKEERMKERKTDWQNERRKDSIKNVLTSSFSKSWSSWCLLCSCVSKLAADDICVPDIPIVITNGTPSWPMINQHRALVLWPPSNQSQIALFPLRGTLTRGEVH